jgi:hypothetical protein
MAAAMAILLLLVSGIALAVATDFLGIQGLFLSTQPFSTGDSDGSTEEISLAFISLQGFVGTPEHAAAVRWQAFRNSYDPDNTGFSADSDGSWMQVPAQYRDYGAFTPEMIAEIHNIAAIYGLSLMGEAHTIHADEPIPAHLASGPFLDDALLRLSGFYRESGLFQFGGQYGDIPFSFRLARKGVFDNEVFITSGYAAYTEWQFENRHGTPLLLVQSAGYSLLITETEEAFVVVTISGGTKTSGLHLDLPPFSSSDLEHFADLIDFRQLG